MIPQGRRTMTEDDIATASGLPVYTWRRRHGADFRARVPVLNPRERLRLYDAAQATAYIKGDPIPASPADDELHPDDLLSDKEAGTVLGIDATTVRAYATTGYLPAGTERHGRTWWTRRSITARRDSPDQRHHNPGRQPGDPRNRSPRYRQDPRVTEVAAVLLLEQVTTVEIAERYQVGQRTAQRLLAAARTQPQD
ncbi:DNA-binding protein [Streptomyces sp. NBC_00347]|uniref:DNA-binding protein n=1 Tax=Streptomyces sp. NBC_00347 TaxID=2975721 RepID=UPI00224F25E6|nr:DNA-binding protein [Streptomyces sp. NBC_00347]MCX5129419.1 DNA-binding protein [Streptomyces sp. NBC_00347]